jgi:hypothetical protein
VDDPGFDHRFVDIKLNPFCYIQGAFAILFYEDPQQDRENGCARDM